MSQGLYTVDPTDTASHGGWPVHTYYLWRSSATAIKKKLLQLTIQMLLVESPFQHQRFHQRISEIAKKKGGCRLQKVNVHHTWSRRMLHNTLVYFLSHISCVYLFCGWKKKKHWTIEIWFPHDFHSFFQTFYFCFMYTSFLFCNVWRTPVRLHVQTTRQFFSWA